VSNSGGFSDSLIRRDWRYSPTSSGFNECSCMQAVNHERHVEGKVFTIGGGYQITTTHFHTSNHNTILSVRFPF